MSEESIVPMTRRVLADAIDGYDDQITALQNAKRELYNTSRAQLAKAGYKPAAAKAEVEACKAAIRKRRAAAKNQQAVEERDALVDEIFEEISSPRARRATHAREDEAVSLPAGYASSSESLKDGANPDDLSQAYPSRLEPRYERSETPVADRLSTATAPIGVPVQRASDAEKPPRSVPVESAKLEMNARAPFAVAPQADRSDPGPIPDFLRREAGPRPVAL
jgi:hypothetical protein